jgi:uncharacterized membrane-anchored protein
MTHKKLLVAVSIPFVLLCLLIVRAEVHISQGKEWNFQVQGYDPRDLLRGHYLRFGLRLDWEDEASQTCDGAEECCLCLTDVGAAVPKVSKLSCETAQHACGSYIRHELLLNLNRYYIPEDQAETAEKILREARMDNEAFLRISVNSNGEPQILDMILHGESLEALIRKEQ